MTGSKSRVTVMSLYKMNVSVSCLCGTGTKSESHFTRNCSLNLEQLQKYVWNNQIKWRRMLNLRSGLGTCWKNFHFNIHIHYPIHICTEMRKSAAGGFHLEWQCFGLPQGRFPLSLSHLSALVQFVRVFIALHNFYILSPSPLS